MKIKIIQFVSSKNELYIQTKITGKGINTKLYHSMIRPDRLPIALIEELKQRQFLRHIQEIIKENPIENIESITIN